MGYRFALFDADNTLLDFTAAEDHAIKDCLSARGLSTDRETISLYSTINDGHWKRLEQGLTTRDRLRVDRFSDFFHAVGYVGDPVAMADDYMEALSRQTQLVEGAMELITSLHGRCGLYIVTNGITSVQTRRFGSCPLAAYFDSCFISEQMGCAKPEKKFFNQVAAAIPNFDPRKALIIGDSLSSDIQGGINAGIDTCWFNQSGKLVPEGMNLTHVVSTFDEIRDIFLR